jgi:hypothetical protein
MQKKIVMLLISLSAFSYSGLAFSACPQALPNNTPGFCGSFRVSAQCHCSASGLPQGMCMNIKSIYDRMLSMFGSVQRACGYQHDTNLQNCIDDWSCYWSGGVTSENELCSGTGGSC